MSASILDYPDLAMREICEEPCGPPEESCATSDPAISRPLRSAQNIIGSVRIDEGGGGGNVQTQRSVIGVALDHAAQRLVQRKGARRRPQVRPKQVIALTRRQ